MQLQLPNGAMMDQQDSSTIHASAVRQRWKVVESTSLSVQSDRSTPAATAEIAAEEDNVLVEKEESVMSRVSLNSTILTLYMF